MDQDFIVDTVGGIMAIIVHFNRFDLTWECLEAVRRQSIPVYVLIVDNGSTDNSPQRLRASLNSRETLISFRSPVGYSEAVNLGVRFAMKNRHKYVLLLGNDTVPDALMAQTLRGTLERCADHAVVGAVQVEYDVPERVVSAGGSLDTKSWTTAHYARGLPLNEVQRSRYYLADYVDFAAAMIPVSAFKHVGMLDARYRFYWEDVDWCWRARALGYHLLVDSTAVVRHRVSATAGKGSERVQYFLLRNRFESALKLRPSWFALRLIVGAILLWLKRRKNGEESKVFEQSLLDFLLRLPYRF
ncbi:MAG: glycosyltransferase family 2 protein [Acidithiobacillus sp.]|nr:glycosyltransferase family 2 protein [Acidithiobacillus sp.]